MQRQSCRSKNNAEPGWRRFDAPERQSFKLSHMFTAEAAMQFNNLRKQRVRIGTQDLKIASIALEHDALLLSANLRDFEQVPGLRVEDWLK